MTQRHNDRATQRNTKEAIKRRIDKTTKQKRSFNRLITFFFLPFNLLIALSVILLLIGCSSNPTVAGGSGTETTNGIVMLSAGKPAVNAKVFIRERDSLLSKTADSIVVFTDSRGFYSVEHDSIARKLITITTDSLGITLAEDVDTVTLSPLNSVRISLNRTAGSLILAGFGESTISDGKVSFDKVPAGWYPIVYRNGSDRFIAGSISVERTLDTTISIANGSVLADFSDGFVRNGLTELIGGTEWYLFSSREVRQFRNGLWILDHFNDTASEVTINAETFFSAITLQAGLYDSSNNYAGLRLKLHGMNLTSLTGFTVRLRGKGTIRLTLESDLLNGKNDQYGAAIALSESFQTIEIPVDSLKLDNREMELKFPWKLASANVRRLELTFRGAENLNGRDSLMCEIDEIILNGVTIP